MFAEEAVKPNFELYVTTCSNNTGYEILLGDIHRSMWNRFNSDCDFLLERVGEMITNTRGLPNHPHQPLYQQHAEFQPQHHSAPPHPQNAEKYPPWPCPASNQLSVDPQQYIPEDPLGPEIMGMRLVRYPSLSEHEHSIIPSTPANLGMGSIIMTDAPPFSPESSVQGASSVQSGQCVRYHNSSDAMCGKNSIYAVERSQSMHEQKNQVLGKRRPAKKHTPHVAKRVRNGPAVAAVEKAVSECSLHGSRASRRTTSIEFKGLLPNDEDTGEESSVDEQEESTDEDE